MNEIIFELQEKSKQVQVAKVGKFKHEIYGNFSISLADLEAMRDNFIANVRRQSIDGNPVLPFDYSHAEGKEAAGWITNLEVKNDSKGIEALFADVDWTNKAKKKIKDKEFRFVSPSIARGYKDAETGKKFNVVLKGAALTNIPFLRDMQAVYALSEERQAAFESLKLSGDSDINFNLDENMPELIKKFKAMSPEDKEKFLAECGLVVKDKKLSEELDQFKNDLKKAQDDLKLSEDENKKLKEKMSGSEDLEDRLKLAETDLKDQKEKTASLVAQIAKKEKEGEFNKMLSEGKVCEAQRDAYMKGDFADFAAKFEPMKLDESGSNDRNDEFKNAEDKIVQLAEDKMGKDNDLSFDNAVSLVLSENPKLAQQIN